MTDLNDFNYTDGVEDVMANYINVLLASTMRSEYNNAETLSADRTLADADTPIQRFDCNGTNRIVKFPVIDTVNNHPFLLVNSSDGGEIITLKSNDATIVHAYIAQGSAVYAVPSGNGGYTTFNSGVSTYGNLFPADGVMINGKISVSVTGSAITVALKTLAGTDPSASDPVHARINGTVRSITSALSVTKAAATNWCNMGSAALATKEVDLFPYLIWNTTPATDVIDIGFSRYPNGNLYSDFSGTSTNEKYLAYGNASAPTSTDSVINIGRFAATLSAGAGYTWSVPTFTNINLMQRPTFETRILTFAGAVTSGSGTPTNPTSITGNYIIDKNKIFVSIVVPIVTKNTAAGNLYVAMPFTPISAVALSAAENSASGVSCNANYQTTPRIAVVKYDATTVWVDGYNILASGWAMI